MNQPSSVSPPFDKKFFASANSSNGFQNEFISCFGEGSGVDRLYILKGGPGTGKSYFLRVLGRWAERQGYQTTYYCCSSDPNSLDGLRVEKTGQPCIGLIDGTAPHVWEPHAPGVREEIINLGIFWNSEILRRHADEITSLSQQKAACYDMAYRFLCACGQSVSAADLMITPSLKEDQLNALAKRLTKGVRAGAAFREIPAYRSCVGMTGCVCLDTYEQMAARDGTEIIYADDSYGLGYRLTEKVYALLREKQVNVMVSRHPVHHHKIDGLYVPKGGLCLLVGEDTACRYPYRLLSLHRYLDAPTFKTVRGEVRHCLKLASEMKACAVQSMKKAGTHHFALETIYASAMDFEAKGKFEKAFCRRLFGD